MNLTKLYPPLLEAEIPAFTKIIKIPFEHNSLVGFSDFIGFQVQVKDLNGKVIYSGQANWDKQENNKVLILNTALLGDNLSTSINWYKFSIAYIGIDAEIGYFSSAAVGKYLGEISDETFNLQIQKKIEKGQEKYIGSYIHNNDPTEKEFSYQFILKDGFGEIKADTGILLHNIQSTKDEATVSYDEFLCNYKLEPQYNQLGFKLNYKLIYKVVTVNNYELVTFTSIEPNYEEKNIEDIPFKIKTELNRKNGSVKIQLFNNEDCSIMSPITGSFILKRLSDKDNYFKFFIIKEFSLNNVQLNQLNQGIILYEDYTVESGCNYVYYIQQLNKENNIYTGIRSYMTSNYISVYFDDIFLYDGERQLNIKFNPKVASFKINIQGTKIETIGNQFPVVLYNGKTYYKEFPLSGLISYNMDETQDFILGLNYKQKIKRLETNHHKSYIHQDENQLIYDERIRYNKNNKYQNFQNDSNSKTNLSDLNYTVEKDFKLAVLEFLNNKKPKLFRSAAEGNYCVMTLNSSLTPIDTLGRMLHSFNSTAYEIMDTDIFVQQLLEDNKQAESNIWETVPLEENIELISIEENNEHTNLLMKNQYVKKIKIDNASPMSVITLGIIIAPNMSDIEYKTFVIGSTGIYNYDCFDEKEYICALYLGDKNNNYSNKPTNGLITIQNSVYFNESLFDNLYKSQNNIILEKEYTQSVPRTINPIYLPLIKTFYTPANNDSYGSIQRLDKIYSLKARNFDIFSASKAKVYIGIAYSILSELNAINSRHLRAGSKVFMSATLKTFIDNNEVLQDYFSDYNYRSLSNNVRRNTSNEIKEYDEFPGSEFYIKYKFTLRMDVSWSDFYNTAKTLAEQEINENTKEFIILPEEDKEIAINIELNTNDFIFNNCIFIFEYQSSPIDLITGLYQLRYNISSKITNFTFYEGQEVI